MNETTESGKLSELLKTFETNLETPVVPGELSTWISNVHESCEHLGPSLRATQVTHEAQFQKIGEQDPELLPRVQHLRQEDEEILRDFDALLRRTSSLERLPAEQFENRPKVDEKISSIVEAGLAFVIRARTQETALATWHLEAFQRDRGLGD